MIKNECEIIKDLMPNYIEDVISKETKEFVENHIRKCSNCKKILDELQKEKMKENSKDNLNEFSEINYLKKYNTKVNIFKFVAIFLIIAIISMWGYIFYRNYCNKKNYEYAYNHYENVHNIVATARENVEKFKENENFLFTTYVNSPYGVDAKLFYYKDGKYKQEWVMKDENKIIWTEYGIMTENGYDRIQLFKGNNYNAGHVNFSSDKKQNDKSNFVSVNCLGTFYKMEIMDSLSLEVRDDTFESKECYVVRNKLNNKEYDEIWIEKKNMIPIRFYDQRESATPNDFRFEWSIGNVTNEDVTIKDKSRKTDNKLYNDILDKLLS